MEGLTSPQSKGSLLVQDRQEGRLHTKHNTRNQKQLSPLGNHQSNSGHAAEDTKKHWELQEPLIHGSSVIKAKILVNGPGE